MTKHVESQDKWLTCPDCGEKFVHTNPNPKKVDNNEYCCVRCFIVRDPLQDVRLYDRRHVQD